MGEEGDSLLEVALESEIPLAHACGGDAVCSTCSVNVLSGNRFLESMEDLEEETLDKLLPAREKTVRLACQTVLTRCDESETIRVLSLEEDDSPSA